MSYEVMKGHTVSFFLSGAAHPPFRARNDTYSLLIAHCSLLIAHCSLLSSLSAGAMTITSPAAIFKTFSPWRRRALP